MLVVMERNDDLPIKGLCSAVGLQFDKLRQCIFQGLDVRGRKIGYKGVAFLAPLTQKKNNE